MNNLEVREWLAEARPNLVGLAKRVAGMRYGDPAAEAILYSEDWSQMWPIATVGDVQETDGTAVRAYYYTGEIGCSDLTDYDIVDDMIMVERERRRGRANRVRSGRDQSRGQRTALP